MNLRYRRIDFKTIGIFTLAAALFFLGAVLLFNGKKEAKEEKEKVSLKEECTAYLCYLLRRELFPFFSVCVYDEGAGEFDEKLLEDIALDEDKKFPELFGWIKKKEEVASEDFISKMQIENRLSMEDNGVDREEKLWEGMLEENKQVIFFVENRDFLNAGSGFVGDTSVSYRPHRFLKSGEKKIDFSKEALYDPQYIREHFYTVDARAELKDENLEPDFLWNYDLKVDKDREGPQILIYHTHSQETFADSVPGDRNDTVYGVGEHLTEILTKQYGYSVYHHSGEYDVKDRDRAYSESAPALEMILEQYPQIQVIIDLHRDGVAEDRHLVQDLDGEGYAQIMFFNGVSCLRQGGDVTRLPNENLKANLASSLRATALGMEFYPGLFRKNYINAYRYNMQYREKSFLIEIGAQTNTVEEAMNACEPLAHILDMVFTGSSI